MYLRLSEWNPRGLGCVVVCHRQMVWVVSVNIDTPYGRENPRGMQKSPKSRTMQLLRCKNPGVVTKIRQIEMVLFHSGMIIIVTFYMRIDPKMFVFPQEQIQFGAIIWSMFKSNNKRHVCKKCRHKQRLSTIVSIWIGSLHLYGSLYGCRPKWFHSCSVPKKAPIGSQMGTTDPSVPV